MAWTVCFFSWWKFLRTAVCWVYLIILWQFNFRLFSLVMENSWSRQLEFWACPTFLGPLDYRLFPKAHMVWNVNNFCLRKLEIWVCPHFFYQLNCFVRHAWLGLSVFHAMENPCLRQFFEVIQLFLDNWIVDCFIRCVWYALWKFCLRQLKFWACLHVF